MTFYVDELKSELEAERERNNEYATEIETLRNELDQFKSKPSGQVHKTIDDESSSEDKSSLKYSLVKLRELFENGRWEKEEEMSNEDEWLRDITTVLRTKLASNEKSLNEMKSKETYMETQMEKVISDFKREIDQLESKLTERDNQITTLKSQVYHNKVRNINYFTNFIIN